MKQKLRRETGITLVALVVTIVVLLILAGVTLMYTMGDNSIFKKAQDAKEKTAEAIKNEQEYINSIDNMVDEYLNGTGNGGTNTPTDEPIENIKSDWATIEKIAQEIAKDDTITSETEEATVTVDGKRYTIKLGDLFEVEYEGEVKRVRVLGFKHDDLVNSGAYGGNHTKASISFEFLDFMTGSTYKSMNGSDTNSGGWANTQMRKDLNGYSTNAAAQSGAIGGVGANLNNKSYIKQVKKKYSATYNSASSVTTCNDYLWLLSASEVVNAGNNGGDSRGYAITKEGEQYKYYQEVVEVWNGSSVKRQKQTGPSGSKDWWWLRSPDYNHSNYFCGIDDNGVSSAHTASGIYGVAPGFCI